MDPSYQPIYQIKKNPNIHWNLLTKKYINTIEVNGKEILIVQADALRFLAKEAFREISFFLRTNHLLQVSSILDDPEASDNDRFVALTLLRNAVEASKGILPSCQDTGTAIIMGKKGQYVWSENGNDKEFLSLGVFDTFTQQNLRYSQMAPLSMFEEKNTHCNLPAQIDIYSVHDSNIYEFLFIAKGGGSANKSNLFQKSRTLLSEENLIKFLQEKLFALGTTACPPYHIALVIGGTSAEDTMKCVKLASTGYLDYLPTCGDEKGRAFRDKLWEDKVNLLCQESKIGAQFGGKYLAHDVRVIRLPRHAASCPVGLGVSCSADRNVLGKISKEGIFLETLEKNPQIFLEKAKVQINVSCIQIDLDQPMEDILKLLSQYPVGTRLLLQGSLIVARDIAHAQIKQLLDAGLTMPQYLIDHPVYYAGPSKTPEGLPSGSFGPTTGNRMDSYVDLFQSLGGSKIMLAKGNRSDVVTKACKDHGGFYLGSIGGPAAILAKESILSMELVAFEELGMEAIRKIKVKNFPAFIICDDKGNNLYQIIKGNDNSPSL